MSLKNKILNILFYIFSIFIVVVIIILYIFYQYGKDLPSELTLLDYLPPTSTRIYSSDDKLIEEYAIEHRIFIPINKIPLVVQGAFLIAEDIGFYNHGGISIKGILRAFFKNSVKSIQSNNNSRIIQGGSTITQQVAKNLLVGNAKKLSRKIREAIMAFRIESFISKNKILEIYLNQLYLGCGCYGVASACNKYFNKDIKEIEPHEAALLAAIPNAPAIYINILNSKQLLQKRNYILYKLYNLGYINRIQLNKSINKSIKINKLKQKHFANYFSDEIFRQISQKVSREAFFRCGYKIITTLNTKIQNCATKALEDGLISFQKNKTWEKQYFYTNDLNKINKSLPHTINKIVPCKIIDNNGKYINCVDINNNIIKLNIQNNTIKQNDIILCRNINNNYELYQQPKVNGGIVVMDADNGDILALSGGFCFDISSFNCITQSRRQPGSTIKPFIYAAALEQGMAVEDIISDSPLKIKLSDGTFYSPHNYNNKSMGKIKLKDGLIYSLNQATVNLALKVGMENIRKLLKDSELVKHDVPISSVLGAIDISPLSLISSFSMFFNKGVMVYPRFIKSIDQYNNKYVNDELTSSFNNIKYKRVISKETANSIKNILEETVKRLPKIVELEQEYNISIFGKTGTTNDFKDAWFVGGFSIKNHRYLVCVFVGYDKPKSLGENQYGAVVAFPIFYNFIQNYLKLL